jgi:hypothetical protein
MADSPLTWHCTELPHRPAEDWVGSDRKRPWVYARVYFSLNREGETPWFWTLADKDAGLAAGYTATIEEAIGAAEHTYPGWRASKQTD